jgi:hypothetical protein
LALSSFPRRAALSQLKITDCKLAHDELRIRVFHCLGQAVGLCGTAQPLRGGRIAHKL